MMFPPLPGQRSRRAFGAATAALALASTACHDSSLPTELTPAASAALASQAAVASSRPIEGEWIVTFDRGVPDAPGLARQLVAQHGGNIRFTYQSAIKGFAASLPEQAVAALAKNPNVASIEADQVVQLAGVQYSPVWGLDRIDQRTLPLSGSFGYANNGAGVNAYIIDTGIRGSHVEFSGRMRSGYDAVGDGNGTNDCNGHGTHVAGTVGGSTYGVAKGVSLYPVRVLSCTGSGTYAGVIAGIDWVTANHVKPAVANMSLGGGYSSTLNQAVANSIAAGVTYAVAAGNNGANACNYSPASSGAAITVAASASSDAHASFSNSGSCVDVYAPGVGIQSAYHSSDVATASLNGTSMASPHVAGAAALYLAANPSASPSAVASAVTGGATQGMISGAPNGTPNLLLWSGITDGESIAPPPVVNDPVETQPPAQDPPSYAPLASLTVDNCARGTCTFDASGSRGTDIQSYVYNFGDGTSATTISRVSHRYSRTGTFTASVTVTDGAGQKSTASVQVRIKNVK